MNFKPYGMEPTVWETYPEQNSISVIPEGSESCDSDFTLAKGIPTVLDIQQQMNECMRLSLARIKAESEIFSKNGFSAKPDVDSMFEEVINALQSMRRLDKEQSPKDDKEPLSPVRSPERVNGAKENSVAEPKTMEHRDLIDLAGEPEKPHAQRNGSAEPKPRQKLESHFVFNSRTSNPFPTNNLSDSKLEAKLSETVDPSASSDWFASLRNKLQDSLSASGKQFFEFNATKFSESASYKIDNTNPFRSYMSTDTASTFQQPANNQPPKPPATFASFAKKSELESQPPGVYQSGPVMYGAHNNSANERNGHINEIMKERQKLIESKRVNVESWIQQGVNSKNYFPNNLTPSPVSQTQRNPLVNGTPDKPIYFNGVPAPNDTSSSQQKVTSEEWLDMVASAIDFNQREKTSSRLETSPSKGMQTTFGTKTSTGSNNTLEPGAKTAPNQRHSINPNTSSNGIAYSQDGAGRIIWRVKKILISNRFVFLIIYRNEAWMAVEEFAAAFTSMSSDTMLKILSIQRIEIPFLKISRSDNSSLFDELDGTSVNVPRDCCNKIEKFLHLVPVKSALKILNKLNIVKPKQVVRATKDQIFPEESTALYDIRTVINAWGQFQQENSLST